MARHERFEIPCRECGKPLIFIRTRAGKNSPARRSRCSTGRTTPGSAVLSAATAHMSGGRWSDIPQYRRRAATCRTGAAAPAGAGTRRRRENRKRTPLEQRIHEQVLRERAEAQARRERAEARAAEQAALREVEERQTRLF